MVTGAFVTLVLAVAAQRLYEVRISRRHVRALKAQGAVEHAPEQMPVMVSLHALWLCACVLEPVLMRRPVIPTLAAAAFALLLAGQALRWWARDALGARWTVPIITLAGVPRVTSGPFRYLNHPNYLGVVLEIAALPLIHTAYVTAASFTLANGLLLAWRITAEEQALGPRGTGPVGIR